MKLNEEFDELYRLSEEIGFRGEQIEEFICMVIHTINNSIRKGLDASESDK